LNKQVNPRLWIHIDRKEKGLNSSVHPRLQFASHPRTPSPLLPDPRLLPANQRQTSPGLHEERSLIGQAIAGCKLVQVGTIQGGIVQVRGVIHGQLGVQLPLLSSHLAMTPLLACLEGPSGLLQIMLRLQCDLKRSSVSGNVPLMRMLTTRHTCGKLTKESHRQNTKAGSHTLLTCRSACGSSTVMTQKKTSSGRTKVASASST
jgi:hypothetical protein